MITLASDFGTPYPAAMKGVLLSRTDAQLVDIAHDFPRQDVRTAAFWLEQVLPYFPPAVHLVVVDPGVGTDRDALVIRAGDHALVGPDNGVLHPVAERLEAGGGVAVYTIEMEGDDPESVTFHGRDVFAPAAAMAHEAGVERIDEVDRFHPTSDHVELRFPEPTVSADEVTGEVLVIDGFGNAITNIPGSVLADRFGSTVDVSGLQAPVARTYAAVDVGEALVTVGSHDNVELAVNQGRGADAFGVEVGDAVELHL
ncbi:MAG: S-adenosyl-l-methionine hydroxide adenosyltransferase family protein [Candidatus Nanohaloarchaea archaeon]